MPISREVDEQTFTLFLEGDQPCRRSYRGGILSAKS
jgi:hypothetical protein